jgi:integrase/recombinase XerC
MALDVDGEGSGRSVAELVVARSGAVRPTEAADLQWVVLDGAGAPIAPISEFLRELLACGNGASSCRSYGYGLLRWFRFLAAVNVPWNRAQRDEVRDFVLWLRTSVNPARTRSRPDAPAPGAINARTGKPSLSAGYAPATINHALSVVAAFYAFHTNEGEASG